MLSNDISVTVLRSNTNSLTDLKTETWRVQHCSATNHTVHRQTTQLPRHVCENIHCKASQQWSIRNSTVILIFLHSRPQSASFYLVPSTTTAVWNKKLIRRWDTQMWHCCILLPLQYYKMSQKTPNYIQKISDNLHFKISHYVMPLPPPHGPQKFWQKSPSCSFLLITS